MEDWVGVDFRGVVLILGSGFSRFCCVGVDSPFHRCLCLSLSLSLSVRVCLFVCVCLFCLKSQCAWWVPGLSSGCRDHSLCLCVALVLTELAQAARPIPSSWRYTLQDPTLNPKTEHPYLVTTPSTHERAKTLQLCLEKLKSERSHRDRLRSIGRLRFSLRAP